MAAIVVVLFCLLMVMVTFANYVRLENEEDKKSD